MRASLRGNPRARARGPCTRMICRRCAKAPWRVAWRCAQSTGRNARQAHGHRRTFLWLMRFKDYSSLHIKILGIIRSTGRRRSYRIDASIINPPDNNESPCIECRKTIQSCMGQVQVYTAVLVSLYLTGTATNRKSGPAALAWLATPRRPRPDQSPSHRPASIQPPIHRPTRYSRRHLCLSRC